jgi:hypothetical protein
LRGDRVAIEVAQLGELSRAAGGPVMAP